MPKGDKRREEEDLEPFLMLEKAQVLNEARCFSDTPLDARRCCSVVTELLCLLSQGENLTPDEATSLFFGVTKLFQSEDPQLRRLVYLVIKELNQDQDQAFIVISSLEKDINSAVEMFKANAIRVHSKVIDSSMLEQRARLFSQALVSANEHISSAALTAGVLLFPSNPEVVRRWVNEVRESTRSGHPMVAFHGLHLLYKINKHDARAVVRTVSHLVKGSAAPESALARCLLIRYAFSVLAKTASDDSSVKGLLPYIKSCIKHFKSPMVMFEAAKALCHVPHVSEGEISVAMNVLQEFLNSPRPVMRFAAVRALSGIVARFPNVLSPSCAVDLEHLITDSNRNIATLAITTLLKTAAEFSIERLLNSISEFMSEITDELKIVLVSAIRGVCKKFPAKYEALLSFLNSGLRDDGGEKYKNSIVDCMLILMRDVERARDFGLEYLCEYIEDCEYPRLSVRIIHLIGDLGPLTPNPKRYIRFIFNRVLLELACVRAAAVSCLTQFAMKEPMLERDIEILLKRSLNDDDDEVRDRAIAFSTLLAYCGEDVERQRIKEERIRELQQDADGELLEDASATGMGAASGGLLPDDEKTKSLEAKTAAGDGGSDSSVVANAVIGPLMAGVKAADLAGFIEVPPLDFNLKDLEYSLMSYLSANEQRAANGEAEAFSLAFTCADVTAIAEDLATASESGDAYERAAHLGGVKQRDAYAVTEQKAADNVAYNEFLEAASGSIPELGVERLCCGRESLTEAESEYQVEVIKHVYKRHIVVQCTVVSTMDDQLLTDVYVEFDDFEDENDVILVECPTALRANDEGTCLLVVERATASGSASVSESDSFLIGEFGCALKFTVKDASSNPEMADFEEGYQDTYQLMPLVFTHRDYLIPKPDITKLQFKEHWKRLEGVTAVQKQGTLKKYGGELQAAIDDVLSKVGLSPVEDSQRAPEGVATHVVNLIAKLTSGQPALMRVAFQSDAKNITFKARVECPIERIAHLILAVI